MLQGILIGIGFLSLAFIIGIAVVGIGKSLGKLKHISRKQAILLLYSFSRALLFFWLIGAVSYYNTSNNEWKKLICFILVIIWIGLSFVCNYFFYKNYKQYVPDHNKIFIGLFVLYFMEFILLFFFIHILSKKKSNISALLLI